MVNLQCEVAERRPEAGSFGCVFGRPGRVIGAQVNRLVDILPDDLGDLGGRELGGVYQVAQVAALPPWETMSAGGIAFGGGGVSSVVASGWASVDAGVPSWARVGDAWSIIANDSTNRVSAAMIGVVSLNVIL